VAHAKDPTWPYLPSTCIERHTQHQALELEPSSVCTYLQVGPVQIFTSERVNIITVRRRLFQCLLPESCLADIGGELAVVLFNSRFNSRRPLSQLGCGKPQRTVNCAARTRIPLLAMASLQLSGACQGWQKSTHFGQLSAKSPPRQSLEAIDYTPGVFQPIAKARTISSTLITLVF
jgi:hypothetical protein